MEEQDRVPELKLIAGGQSQLETLHDEIMTLLDTYEKRGIRQLLKRNNDSCKKLIFPYFKSDRNKATVMTALTGILDAHARECYTIGYLDCTVNRDADDRKKTEINP